MPLSSPLLASAEQRAKAAALRATLGLPERMQRMLAGRRVTIDGQTLAVDTQLMLRLERVVREPSTAALPLAAGRRLLVQHTEMAGRRQPIGAVRNLEAAGRPARLYVPTAVSSPGPLLVFFHGGGWVYGDLDSHDPPCRFLAERSGVRVLSVDYRLAPEHPFPAACDDAVAAYRWVVENAAGLGGGRDPTRCRWRLRGRQPGRGHGPRGGAGRAPPGVPAVGLPGDGRLAGVGQPRVCSAPAST